MRRIGARRSVTLIGVGLLVAVVAALCAHGGGSQHHTALTFAPEDTPQASVSVTHAVPTAKPASEPKRSSHVVHYSHASSANVVPVSYVAGGIEDRTALIVGIAHAAGNTVIESADTDAQIMRTALIRYGFPPQNIQTLVDSQATRGNVLAALHSLAARTSSNGIAVFSVSAHSSSDSFRTFEGDRVTKYEVANALGSIRGRVWANFAVCYAASYDVPGITGAGRVATFSSAANELTWGSASYGSDLIHLMVHDGMIDGKAPSSVESAFAYAKPIMNSEDHTPQISDGVPGGLVLGTYTAPAPVVAAPVPPVNVPPVSVPVTTPQPTPVQQPPDNGGLLGGLLGGLFGHHR
jgi:hypothetical protein